MTAAMTGNLIVHCRHPGAQLICGKQTSF